MVLIVCKDELKTGKSSTVMFFYFYTPAFEFLPDVFSTLYIILVFYLCEFKSKSSASVYSSSWSLLFKLLFFLYVDVFINLNFPDRVLVIIKITIRY